MQRKLRNAIVESENELKTLKESLARTRELIFQIVNQPSKLNINFKKTLKEFQIDAHNLCKILGVSSETEFQEAIDAISSQKEAEIEIISKEIKILSDKLAKMKADAASRTKDNLDLNHNRLQIKKDLLNILNQIKQMKLEVQKQRNAIEKRIQDTKERIKKLLQNAFEEGSKILTEKQKQVNKQQAELNRMNQEMQETMQNLKTNIDRIEKKFLSSPDESPQDPNKLLIDIDALADGKIEPKNLTQEFNLKLNDFEIRIDKTIQKVIETSETIQKDEEFEKLKRAIQRQYQIKENFKMLLRIGRKAALTQGILKKMTAMSMETSKIITQQIQLENTNPGAKVADTNLTFPEMRKAIIAMK